MTLARRRARVALPRDAHDRPPRPAGVRRHRGRARPTRCACRSAGGRARGGWVAAAVLRSVARRGSFDRVRAGARAVGRALPVVPLDVSVRAADRARSGPRAVGHGLEQFFDERAAARRERLAVDAAGHDRHQLRELSPRRPRARRGCGDPLRAARRAARRRARASGDVRRAAHERARRQRDLRAVPLGAVAAARRRHRAAQLERGARSRGVAVHRHQVHRLPRSASRRLAWRRGARGRGVHALPRRARRRRAAAHAGAGHATTRVPRLPHAEAS